MKTTQIMKRDFTGSPISQRTSDKFFNATELLALYNTNNAIQKVLPEFWKNQGTQAFLTELDNEILNVGISIPFNSTNLSWESTRGRNGATWMHPYLFVKFAMWLSPKFELQIIKWVYDNLIDFRHEAGDYYKEMCNALKDYHENNSVPTDGYMYAREANILNLLVFGSTTAKQRNDATEHELALMNDLQLYNITQLEDGKTLQQRKQGLYERAKSFNRIAQRRIV